MDGFIVIHRKIMDWGWYKDANTYRVFLELLFRANFKDTQYMGRVIPRGSIAVKIGDLAASLSLSSMQIRTALDHLKKTGEISVEATHKYIVAKVHNYDVYQSPEFSKQHADNNQITIKQHTDNTPIEEQSNKATKQQVEKKKIKKKNPEPPKTKYAEFVSMTNDEYSSLVAKVGEAGTQRCVEILDNYKGANGKRYASDYRAILNWVVERYEQEKGKQAPESSTGNVFFDMLREEGKL